MKKTMDKKLNLLLSSNSVGKTRVQDLILIMMKLRNKKGFTQNQLANESGISHTSIARIENFTMQPTLKVVLQILDVYGMTLDIVPKTNIKHDTVKLLKISDDNSLSCKKNHQNRIISKSNISFNKVLSFLKHKISLRTEYKTNYSSFIGGIFTDYYNFLVDNKANAEVKDSVKQLERYLQLVLSEYYRGQHNSAYYLFKNALESCVEINLFLKNIENGTEFYRCRTKGNNKYTSNELFHIPFDERYSVSTQRYSFPGLPCLYLGASPKICALECSNNISELVTAKLIYHCKNYKHRILDLTSIFFEPLANQPIDCSEAWLKSLPLYLICSTNIDYKMENVAFKQEYIIPQLLLEYIINETTLNNDIVIGIKYFSTKINVCDMILNNDYDSLKESCNYVFPARDPQTQDGHCSLLSDCFEIVEITE